MQRKKLGPQGESALCYISVCFHVDMWFYCVTPVTPLENGRGLPPPPPPPPPALDVQHTYFFTFHCRCFARPQRKTSRNVLVKRCIEEMSYVLSFTLFSLPLIFSLHWWPLAVLILSSPLQNFHVVLYTKKMSPLFFISRSRYPSPFLSLSFGGLPPTSSFSLRLWT